MDDRVFGQQGRQRFSNAKQVVERVLILAAIHPPQHDAAIGLLAGGSSGGEFLGKPDNRGGPLFRGRLRSIGRRHLARLDAVVDADPRGVVVVGGQRFEREPRRGRRVVVAVDTVGLERFLRSRAGSHRGLCDRRPDQKHGNPRDKTGRRGIARARAHAFNASRTAIFGTVYHCTTPRVPSGHLLMTPDPRWLRQLF